METITYKGLEFKHNNKIQNFFDELTHIGRYEYKNNSSLIDLSKIWYAAFGCDEKNIYVRIRDEYLYLVDFNVNFFGKEPFLMKRHALFFADGYFYNDKLVKYEIPPCNEKEEIQLGNIITFTIYAEQEEDMCHKFKLTGSCRGTNNYFKVVEDVVFPENPEEEQNEKVECTLLFRRADNYDGSFGFDWLRTGDTGKPYDKWYKDILESNNYDALVAEYGKFDQEWKKTNPKYEKNYQYVVPWLTLMEGETATLHLKLEVETPGKSVKLSCANAGYFTLSRDTIPADRTNECDITIKCNKTFNNNAFICAYDDNGEQVGMLGIPSNKPKHLNVAIITTKTVDRDDRSTEFSRKPNNIILGNIKKILKQAYIIPNFISFKLDLTADGKTYKDEHNKERNVPLIDYYFKFNDNKQINYRQERGLREYKSFHNFLNKMLYDKNPQMEDELKNMYKLYFINESVSTGYRKTDGLARSPKHKEDMAAIIFKPGYDSFATPSHELIHCLDIEHSFDRSELYYYTKFKTDNIMDYIDDKQPDTRISLWLWQMKKIWNKLK